MIRRPRCEALVRCTGECVSRATDISGRSVHLTAPANWRLLDVSSAALGATCGAVAARGAGFSGRTPKFPPGFEDAVYRTLTVETQWIVRNTFVNRARPV